MLATKVTSTLLNVRPKGLEPLTFWSEARRSIQLSYGRIKNNFFHCAFSKTSETNF